MKVALTKHKTNARTRSTGHAREITRVVVQQE